MIPLLFGTVSLSFAEPIKMEAFYDPESRTIKGVIESNIQEWSSDLENLAVPNAQWLIERSFPFAPNQGKIVLNLQGELLDFTTSPPQRWDLAGWDTSGLYMNGNWHPTTDVKTAKDWHINLTVPHEYWIVLNGQVFQGTAEWKGLSISHDLSIFKSPHVHYSDQHILIAAKPPIRQSERLGYCLMEEYPATTIVVAPMHHRLVHAGNQQIWLSEHALEGDLGLWKTHCDVINRAFYELHSTAMTKWARKLDAQLVYPSSQRMHEQLNSIKWVPEIDYILHSGRLPYYSDIFTTEPVFAVPTWDNFSNSTTNPVYSARQLNQNLTVEQKHQLQDTKEHPIEKRLIDTGITQKQLDEWSGKPVKQNLKLMKDNGTVWLVRETNTNAPTIDVPVEIDDQMIIYPFPKGPGRYLLPSGRNIKVDPNNTVSQETRTDDSLPRPWNTTASIFPYSLSTDTWRPSIVGRIGTRPHPTHPLRLITALSTSPVQLVGIEQYLTYGWGTPLDSRARPINTWISGGLQIPEQNTPMVRSLGVGGSVDTRSTWLFPRTGGASSLSLARASSSTQQWNYGRLSLVGIRQLSNRLVAVQKIHYAHTGSRERETQYPIGGLSAVASYSTEDVRGSWRFVSNTELRVLTLRNMNVHFPLMRWTDLIVHLGTDYGLLEADVPYQARGFIFGLSAAGDVLDVRPGFIGFTTGLNGQNQPQFYIHATHRL